MELNKIETTLLLCKIDILRRGEPDIIDCKTCPIESECDYLEHEEIFKGTIQKLLKELQGGE